MAQFYGDVTGNRGHATRMGTKGSGMYAHIRGWRVGARVVLTHVDGVDMVTVYRTGGSNGVDGDTLLAEFSDAKEEVTK